MSDEIQLRGVHVLAICGTLDHERENKQPFEIDIDLETDLALSSETDNLADTVDYGPICEMIEQTAEHHKFMLIEKMAQYLVDNIFKCDDRISAVRLTLRKMHPPVEIDISSAAVHIYRTRQ